MKKFLVLIITLVCAFLFVGCDNGEKVMTYAEYDAVEVGDEILNVVVVETYIQAKQGWWENNGVGNASFYTQDEDGGYFLYNMPCTKEDYDNKLTIGTKIRVKGEKVAWSGEVEIQNATYEVIEGSLIAKANDVTSLLGTEDLIKKMNTFIALKGLTVVESETQLGEKNAFLYNWDGSGEKGTNSDIYFKLSDGENVYTLTVESYLCGEGTDVYKAAEALKVGDTVDVEGFLYWYNGAQPHVTKIEVK